MNKVEACLTEIGVPANIQGFGYLCDAIYLVAGDRRIGSQRTKRLYPEVAEKNETTGSRVERSIRHAIEVAFNHANATIIPKYFGNVIDPNRGKPTNSQFIASVVLHLKDELEEEQKNSNPSKEAC